ncbi:MAG TPA: BrnT family toxin [Anaerolineae bacterium]|nr:BrnT family toxin [Anaerolineae bacterium]
MDFDWDPQKAAKNLRKHKVSFGEAATVFSDPLSVTVSDPDHSDDEDRYIIVGMSQQSRLLIVSFAERGDLVRVISARKLTRSERQAYEEKNRE